MKAILEYKLKSFLEVDVIEKPKHIFNYKNSTSNYNKPDWDNLIIKFENDQILEDVPSNFKLTMFDEKGFVYNKFLITDVYSYEKDGDNIVISFDDCIVDFNYNF